jgi:hypothetical protein
MRVKECRIPGCKCGDRPERAKLSAPKWKEIGPGIRQYPDGHIERTPAAMRRFKEHRLSKGDPCFACHEAFTDCREIEVSHVESKGMNGWKRNDADANLVLMHRGANRAQGSMPLDVYLREHWKIEHCQ